MLGELRLAMRKSHPECGVNLCSQQQWSYRPGDNPLSLWPSRMAVWDGDSDSDAEDNAEGGPEDNHTVAENAGGGGL